jgi:hypothetical protein
LLPKIADKAIVIDVLVARRRRSSVCVAMFIEAARGSFDTVELEDDLAVDAPNACLVSIGFTSSLVLSYVDEARWMFRCLMPDELI